MTDRDFSILFLLVVGPLLVVVVLGRDVIVGRNWCVQYCGGRERKLVTQ
jgi:hypothetical protein